MFGGEKFLYRTGCASVHAFLELQTICGTSVGQSRQSRRRVSKMRKWLRFDGYGISTQLQMQCGCLVTARFHLIHFSSLAIVPSGRASFSPADLG
ncbi:hypothetical protein FVEG_04669 [Fusarium verticillioides 7600]|uniref:Uncharacterized protein n=1 Tax=Gibberella moniliformis (strain M3125 / FGSC 7600) TaxID=334819 RepID=W7M6D1_GIBM7|nr:hypothetical protein FVEG_04669 [Fusarium verticillioides 7600]EWG43024.1 hypothetical protein FVEG_04669 [Fusarium verticillioides 7600]